MTGWLDPVCRALDAVRQPVDFFFRNDDVGWGDERLFPLLDLFAVRGLPVDLAVIPAALGDDMARRLSDRCVGSSGLIRVHQHGWRHANHEAAGRKCEFGLARAVANQAADLKAGRERLQAALGPFVDPVFTPPWNRCAQATVDVLAAEGFRVLSRDAGARPLDACGMEELPVSVDWQEGEGREESRTVLGQQIACAAGRGRPVGTMLHHGAMTGEHRAGLGALLDLLVRHDKARCVSMMDCVGADTEPDQISLRSGGITCSETN